MIVKIATDSSAVSAVLWKKTNTIQEDTLTPNKNNDSLIGLVIDLNIILKLRTRTTTEPTIYWKKRKTKEKKGM